MAVRMKSRSRTIDFASTQRYFSHRGMSFKPRWRASREKPRTTRGALYQPSKSHGDGLPWDE